MKQSATKQTLVQRAKAATLAAVPAAERVSARQACDIQWLLEGGLSDAAIAERVQLPVERVAQVIDQGGLRLIIDGEGAKTKDQKQRDRWTRAVALASRSLSLAGFGLASDAAAAGDALAFSMAAKGTKAFVDMARQADGMDDKEGPGAGAPSVNLFFFNGDVMPSPTRRAEPVRVDPMRDALDAVEPVDELGFA